jgi:proteasome lid subunit RPN8/RPN11
MTTDAIHAMVTLAQAERPREACGFVIGAQGLGTEVVSMTNIHPKPVGHYRMDDEEVIKFYAGLDQRKLDVVAVFHSHPESAARMSTADIDEARDISIPYVIVGMRGGQPTARAWRVSLRAVGVKAVEEARLLFSQFAAAVEEPAAPWALYPGNRVRIMYRAARNPEGDLSGTTAVISSATETQVYLHPEYRQRNKPVILPMDRIREVTVLRESDGAKALRREMIGHAKHLQFALARDDEMAMVADLTKALTVAFPATFTAALGS